MHTSFAQKVSRGFTLLELLIVIAILAILAAVVIIVLNPAQTLAQARDAQRLSDLSTIKSAISLYMTTVSPVDLDTGVTHCLGANNTGSLISYSETLADATCLVNVAEGADVDDGSLFAFTGGTSTDFCRYTATNTVVDGTGWIPVNFNNITGGTPLSNLPLDPTNNVTDAAPTSTEYAYRYACQQGTALTAGAVALPSPAFELDAVLESTKYAGTDNLDEKDGGDNTAYYEVGTSLRLIGTGTNF